MFPKRSGNKLSSVNTEGFGFASRNVIGVRSALAQRLLHVQEDIRNVLLVLFACFFKLGFCTAGAFSSARGASSTSHDTYLCVYLSSAGSVPKHQQQQHRTAETQPDQTPRPSHRGDLGLRTHT